jgi:5'-nucleotidase
VARGRLSYACVAAALIVIAPLELTLRSGSAALAVSPPIHAQEQESSPRARAALTLLQINDVYATAPVDGVGGLARVATIKRQVAAATGRAPLLVLAGDFLSPSVASSVFKGEQMIAALNAAGLDMATLGNHEFDFGDDVLIERMREARWQWIVSNVVDTRTGQPIGGAAPALVRTFGGVKVGFLGLCLNTSEISADKLTHTRIEDPLAAAAAYVPRLKADGAAIIVAITHLAFATDRTLVERFPDIDLVVGGHEHYVITATENRTLISKAGTDARFVARLDVGRRPEGTVERFYELLPVNGAVADEPDTAAVVADFEKRLGTALDAVIGTTTVPLDAVSARLRASERNVGNFVADAVRADAHADIAIVNSGSIRGDRVYPAGPIARRTIVALHPFGNVICTVAVPGRVVLEALDHGVAAFPAAAGQFPQVSGLTFVIDPAAPAGQRATDVRVAGEPLDPQRTYTVAIPDYLLKGGDGYTMFSGARVLVAPEAGDLIATALERYVAARREIAPRVEGRITVK